MPLARDTDARFGKHDDGREGVVLTKTSQGGLVKYPVLNYGTGTSGSATVTWDAGSSAANPDGTGASVTITCTNGNVNAVGWIEQQVWGSAVGVRFLRDSNATRAPFAVIIDGLVHKVTNVTPIDRVGNVASSPEYEAAVLVADDLGPGPHTVRVALYGDVNGTGTRVLNLFGFLLDPSAGYQQRPQGTTIMSSNANITVPTAATVFGSSNNQRIAAIHLRNTSTTTTRTVTLLRANVAWKVITLAAGADFDYQFPGGPIQVLSDWKWQVDAGADVTGTLITGGTQ